MNELNFDIINSIETSIETGLLQLINIVTDDEVYFDEDIVKNYLQINEILNGTRS